MEEKRKAYILIIMSNINNNNMYVWDILICVGMWEYVINRWKMSLEKKKKNKI
jgi:hypothetical protein